MHVYLYYKKKSMYVLNMQINIWSLIYYNWALNLIII